MDGVFIQARLKSTRLPKKVIIPVLGKPVIQYQIDRLKSNFVYNISILTSTNPQDDPLEGLARRNHINCYRGSEDDVIDRLYQACKRFHIDKFYLIFGDEPFIELTTLQNTILCLDETKKMLIQNTRLPEGTYGYGLTCLAVEEMNLNKTSFDNEVWGQMVKNLNVEIIDLDPYIFPISSEVRLTIDYPEDLDVFRKLIEIIGDRYNTIPIEELITIYKNHELNKINGFRSIDYKQRITDQGKKLVF
jgi:spore coat polysaccharide biosynthesis protein SpsF